jgi:serine/threonine protein kinase/DNA-binding beta-propeller fold protein YncE
MAEISIGSVLGGYRIEGVAGEGGMGRVYRATQLALNRQVAVKVIVPELAHDADFRARFQRESELSASIDHPNVIPVYEAGEADGRLFIAMRWVEGTDLRSVIISEGRLDPSRIVAIVEQVAAALDAAHSGGLVHRDVKPANVMMTSTHGGEHVYLTDFGLTKRAGSATQLTKTGAFVGTPDYMAPEQIKGERADARADVYALGCLLFHALSGRPPYDRDTEVAKMYAQLHDPPPTLTDSVPGGAVGLDAVIARALAKEASGRYPSAGDLARAARAALTGTMPALPERSLATGLAAPGAVTPPPTPAGAGPTAASPPPAAPSPPPASASPPPAAPSPPPASATPPPTAATPAPPAGPPAAGPGPPRPPAPARRSPLPIVVGALLAVLVIGGVLAAAGVFSGDSGGDGSGGFRDTAGGQPTSKEPGGVPPSKVATIPAGDGPDGIAVAGSVVYVSNAVGNALTRLDTTTNEPKGDPIPVGRNPDEVVAANGVVWVANTDDGTVSRLEGDSQKEITVGAGPEGLSLGKQFLWVANGDSDSVTRIDPASGTVVGSPIAVQNKPIGIFAGKRFVWVTNSFSESVSRIDPSSGQVVGTTEGVGKNIRSVTEAFGFVWVSSAVDDGTVVRLDPANGRIVGRPIPVGQRPKEMAAAGGFLWVVEEFSRDVIRIDPKTAKVVGKPIRVGQHPVGLTYGAGSLWVTNNGSDNVTRIAPGR